jgi:hypothetical protein
MKNLIIKKEKKKMEELEINGETWVRKNDQRVMPDRREGMEYCIIRTQSAGVFAGWFDRSTKGQEGTVCDARGIWYWEGACGLSQLATDGTSKPENCKFTVKADHDLKQIIEVIPCTEKAQESIEGVAVWKK